MVISKVEKMKIHFLECSEVDLTLREKTYRVQQLYTTLQDRMTKPQIAWDENSISLDGLEFNREPLVIRRARAFEKTLVEMPIAIESSDLIVGNVIQNDKVVRTRLPVYATQEEYSKAGEVGASISAHLGHKTPSYDLLFEKGIAGLISDIDLKITEIGSREICSERIEKLDFFKAMRIECNAMIKLANRFACLAEKMVETANTTQRKNELRIIADVCRRVPLYSPRTFHEAVQAFWLIHLALFSTGTNLSCGRFDQFLYPYLKTDLECGKLSLKEAQELVDCVWIRFNDRGQIVRENFFPDDDSIELNETQSDSKEQGQSTTLGEPTELETDQGPMDCEAGHRKRHRFATDAADAINHFGQNILLSGITSAGIDGTNELTYLCLNALEKFAFTSPVVTARLHKDSPSQLVDRVAEVLKTGSGMPYINNDNIIVDAYADLGIPLVDSRNYANSNCWETMIEGMSDQELIRGMNFALFLELALGRGKSTVHGRMGPDSGDPREFETFNELMAAWKQQTSWQVQQGIEFIGEGIKNGDLEHSNHGRYSYNPLLSALTLDCIENEQDVIRGGARYTIWHVMGEGVANAVDSLAAIKRAVFQDKTCTMDKLLDALESDWREHENLRRMLVEQTPKFANDDDEVDRIGREVMEHFVKEAKKYARRYPSVVFPCSVGTFSWYAMIGKEVAATADGRKSGEPIAANFSPSPGMDSCGPTAAINSYLKMPVNQLAGGGPIDLRLSLSGLKGTAGTQRLAGLIKAFVVGRGNMLTLTITDVEDLKKAMDEPEKYRHLRVRMGGWSAYFVMLSKKQQLLHIKRVEHGLV